MKSKSVDLLRYEFGELVNERRKTILCVSFSNGSFTNVNLDPCTLEEALQMVADIEEYGITVAAEKYSSNNHLGDMAEGIVFRHPAHTIARIEIMRRRAWRVIADETEK